MFNYFYSGEALETYCRISLLLIIFHRKYEIKNVVLNKIMEWIRYMKNRKLIGKALITLSVIFFITSIVVQVNRTRMDIKEIVKGKPENSESKKNFNSDFIKQNNKQIDDKAKKILELFNTINDAIQYMNNNLNKEKLDNIEILTENSIEALNSIEKNLFDENNQSDLKKQIDLLKSDFEELNKAAKDKDLNKSKEIMNNRITKDYELCFKAISSF